MANNILKTSLELCKTCRYVWKCRDGSSKDIACNYFLDTGKRRECPVGYCDKYDKITKSEKKSINRDRQKSWSRN